MSKYDPEEDPAVKYARRRNKEEEEEDVEPEKLPPWLAVAIACGIIAVIGLLVWMVVSLVFR